MFVIFDLDDTLTNTKHRAHLPPNWEEFYRQCVNDTPYSATVTLLKTLRSTGHHCEIWTGRSEMVRAETEEWFRTWVGFVPSVIRMRPIDYNGPNVVLKEQWLKECPNPPDLVFEDRQDIAEMYRSYGCRVAVFCPKPEAENVDNLVKETGVCS